MGACGPGKFGGRIVPDRPFGLDLHPCCRFHDWLYEKPFYPDRRLCDIDFLWAMNLTVRDYPRWRRPAYYAIARAYYAAVRAFGGLAWRRARKKDV